MIKSVGGRVVATVLVGGVLTLSGCSRSKSTTTAKGSATTVPSTTDAAFGTMQPVCGPAKGTNKATGRGVTADSISLGVLSDAGFVGKPGLNQELWDASDVFVKWCNSLGGINGRKLIGNHLDAALTQYKQKVLTACNTSFALVGGGGVLDDSAETDRLKCLLPSFPGFLLTPIARASELKWQINPAPLTQLNVRNYRWLAQKFPDSVSNVGLLTANVSATISLSKQIKETFPKVGFTFGGYDQQYNALGESTWVPFAAAMKQKGVKGLLFQGEPQDLAKLEQAMTAIGYKPTWIGTLPNIYDQSFLDATAGKAFNTYVPAAVYPFTLADKKAAGSAATQKYLSLFATYSPKGKARTYLGVESFASWLYFAEAASACGADLTTRCLYDQAQKITSFDAGGLIAPATPASGAGSPCQLVVEASGSGFTVAEDKPTKGVFNCDPQNLISLTGNYGKGVTLASVGKSVADLK